MNMWTFPPQIVSGTLSEDAGLRMRSSPLLLTVTSASAAPGPDWTEPGAPHAQRWRRFSGGFTWGFTWRSSEVTVRVRPGPARIRLVPSAANVPVAFASRMNVETDPPSLPEPPHTPDSEVPIRLGPVGHGRRLGRARPPAAGTGFRAGSAAAEGLTEPGLHPLTASPATPFRIPSCQSSPRGSPPVLTRLLHPPQGGSTRPWSPPCTRTTTA